ncbi:MAG: homoserine kinase [Micavibrio sp.]
MAVYTRISKEELEEFLTSYAIGALVRFEGIEAGVSNTNYFVTTEKGRYVLTLFEPHRVRPEDIPFFLDYTIALQKGGVPCPETILRRDGSPMALLKNRPAALFSVLEGREGRGAGLTGEMCFNAGSVLAKMHLIGAGLRGAGPNHFGLARWKEWDGAVGARADGIAAGLEETIRAEMAFIEKNWPDDLPLGAIHGDYFPDNVFFDGDDVTGVIDFHFVCRDFFAYDLAIAINAWCFDAENEFVPERREMFLRGYGKVRPLTGAETAALPLLSRAASLRFLLSRIEEKLGWDGSVQMTPHDPLVFAKRLGHFQAADKDVQES